MIAQILGICAFIFLAFSFLMKKKEIILLFQIFSQIFYSVSYLLLNALSGYAYAIVNLLRCFFIAIKDKHEKLNNNLPLFIFIVIYCVVGVYTYQNVYSLFSIVAVIIYTSMIWQGTVKEIKYAGIINSTLWFVYNINFHAYTAAVGDLIIITCIVISLLKGRYDARRKTKVITK